MNELELLKHIYATATAPSAEVPIPPGDDMAMVSVGGRSILVAIDQVVAGCHYDEAVTPLSLVGRKAITRCLSDVAAMAARPLVSLVAATLPVALGERRATELFDAVRETAEHYDCPLIGGDIAIYRQVAGPLVCSVAIMAEPTGLGPIRRAGARVGDRVYVTGVLGGTRADDGLGHHLLFEPRLAEARLLAKTLGQRLHAMIDLSDGLGRDASHLAERSGVQIVFDAERIPCRSGAPWRQALSEGEDYELCFVATGEVPSTLEGIPVTAAGEVCRREPGAPLVVVRSGGRNLDATELGWEHRSP